MATRIPKEITTAHIAEMHNEDLADLLGGYLGNDDFAMGLVKMLVQDSQQALGNVNSLVALGVVAARLAERLLIAAEQRDCHALQNKLDDAVMRADMDQQIARQRMAAEGKVTEL